MGELRISASSSESENVSRNDEREKRVVCVVKEREKDDVDYRQVRRRQTKRIQILSTSCSSHSHLINSVFTYTTSRDEFFLNFVKKYFFPHKSKKAAASLN